MGVLNCAKFKVLPKHGHVSDPPIGGVSNCIIIIMIIIIIIINEATGPHDVTGSRVRRIHKCGQNQISVIK